MFRVSKYATNISENVFRCSPSIMDFLSIRITEQSVIAIAEHRRRGCPVRQPSPKNSLSFRMPIVASFPSCDTTVSFTSPYIENSIGRVALSKNRLFFGKSLDLPAAAVDGRKECLEIELAEFLGRCHEWHDWPPLKNSECAEGNLPQYKKE